MLFCNISNIRSSWLLNSNTAGLRISEGCKLRVKDFNFDTGLLSVRGKGEKVRTVPLPERLVPELQAQLETVKKLHDEDLVAGFAGVFLDDQLEKKYPKAAKDLVWQWFFPQESLTFIVQTKQRRRRLWPSHYPDPARPRRYHCLPGKATKDVKSPLDF